MIKLLPIGTVVHLKGDKIPYMIAGYFPESPESPGEYYDYSGFPYPFGFTSDIEASFFGQCDIEGLMAMGYQDEESLALLRKLEQMQKEDEENG